MIDLWRDGRPPAVDSGPGNPAIREDGRGRYGSRCGRRRSILRAPFQFLVETMNDQKQDPFARIAAAKLILDRGLGKVKEVELPPEPVQQREIAPEELRFLKRMLRIDHYQQQGWQIPPDLTRYEAALRILREPEPEDLVRRNWARCKHRSNSLKTRRPSPPPSRMATAAQALAPDFHQPLRSSETGSRTGLRRPLRGGHSLEHL